MTLRSQLVRAKKGGVRHWLVRWRAPRPPEYAPSSWPPRPMLLYWTLDEDEARYVLRRMNSGVTVGAAVQEWRAACDAGTVEELCQV